MPAVDIEVTLDGATDLMPYVRTIDYVEGVDMLDGLVVDVLLTSHVDHSALIKTFVPGKPLVVKLMSAGSPVHEGTCDLVRVRHSRSGTRHEVRLVGLDALHRLRHGIPEATVWEGTHSDIVTEIANRNGLTPTAEGVDGTAGVEFQYNVSDAVFLNQMAKRNNYFIRVQGKDLTFGRKQGSGTTIELTADDIRKCTAEANVDGLVTAVTCHGDDYLTDELISGEAATADLAGVSGGDTGASLVTTAFGDIPLVVQQTGCDTATAATALAKGILQDRADRFFRGTVEVYGDPKALSGLPLKLTGLGWPLDGTFMIRQTRHVLRAGSQYRTVIDFQSDSFPAVT